MKPESKHITRFLALLFIFTSFSPLFAQELKIDTFKIAKTRTVKISTVWTPPKFILQFSIGWNFGAMELNGHNGGFSRFDFGRGKTFGARNGFGFALTGKLPLHKKAYFWANATTAYQRFQSDLIAKNSDEGRVYYNAFNEGLGADYNFTPTHKVKYFVGFNFLLSIISGKAYINNPDGTSTNITIKSSVRLGYAVYTGLEYAFDKNVGFNFGIKFSHLNLLLKKTTDPAGRTEIDLNDDSFVPNVSYAAPLAYAGWKQFAYTTVFGGMSYYFGVKERRYKIP